MMALPSNAANAGSRRNGCGCDSQSHADMLLQNSSHIFQFCTKSLYNLSVTLGFTMSES